MEQNFDNVETTEETTEEIVDTDLVEASPPRNSKKLIEIASIVFVVALIALAVGYFFSRSNDTVVTIGIAPWVLNQQFKNNIEGFKEGLAKNGYGADQVNYIQRNSDANSSTHRKIIQGFIDSDVDLIYSLTTSGTLIAKDLTADSQIPVVFSIVTYPVEAGIIESLESSGNNLVGTRNFFSPARQYEVFEKIFPGTKTLAFVHRQGEPNSIIQYDGYLELLSSKGISIVDIAATNLDHIKIQLESSKGVIDSLFSACDTLIQSGGEEIVIAFAKENGIPSFTCNKDGVLKGALIGNAADFKNIGTISGEKAAQVLNGTEPTLLQTESPREDFIYINATTASNLNLNIPFELNRVAKDIVR